jgi:hypothetical protein
MNKVHRFRWNQVLLVVSTDEKWLTHEVHHAVRQGVHCAADLD